MIARRSSASRVVINGRFLAKPTSGVGRVGCELLRALIDEVGERSPEITLRVAAPASAAVGGGSDDGCVRAERGFASRWGEQLGLPLLYPGATILSMCNATPLLAWRSVIWIHDAHVFEAPDTYSRAYRLWHRAILTAARVRNFEVVTVSEYSRERLIHHGVAPHRLRIIPNGGDHILRSPPDARAMQSAGLEAGRFVLVLGSPARHKNVPFAVEALLAHAEPDLRIAVVGLSQAGAFYNSSGAVVGNPRVAVLPRIDDAELRALYASARAVVVPSLLEGFGLYAAEAMFADSAPLVLSDRTALPEVGGDAALYFDPTDRASLARAVAEAVKPDVSARLRDAALVQREKFRWRRAARQVIDAFLQ